jgi:hypothetical protein
MEREEDRAMDQARAQEGMIASDADGYLLEEVNAILVEGLLSIQIAAGTRCMDTRNERRNF